MQQAQCALPFIFFLPSSSISNSQSRSPPRRPQATRGSDPLPSIAMSLTLKAKCFNGQSYDLTLPSSSIPVSDLQHQISSASGITPDRQTILFKGQVLDASSSTADYGLADGSTISVVRRIGKPSAKPPPPAVTKPAPPTSAAHAPAEETTAAPPIQPTLEDMMRSLNMSAPANPAPGAPDFSALLSQMGAAAPAAPGAPGAPGSGAAMPDLASLMGGAAGAAPPLGAGGAPANMEQLLAQLPQMMNGLMKTPMLQEYLNDPEKQKQSREAILSNPMLKGLLDSDPEFAKVVSDPNKWQQSMQAAKSLFNADGEAEGPAAGTQAAAPTAGAAAADRALKTRQSAADIAPPGIDIKKLSESYGHALGQSLINSGLGLDPDLVVQGLKSAVDGKAFPMALPDYERSMASLQNIASEFLTKANLEDANNFFQEIKAEGQAVVLEEGKVAYERADVEPDTAQPVADDKSTVLVIVTARLLDGRHFFTCPAADESGESVHPLTLPLETAPPSLAKGIVGMRENESRLLYVHPTACEGMSDMFGDLLPPNALLIFDLQLVSANAPEEETIGEPYYSG